MPQQHLLTALGLLIRKYGYRADLGYEIYIPDTVLRSVSPEAQIQEQRHPNKPGICVRYLPNLTIQGSVQDEKSSSNGFLQPPKKNEP